MTKLVVTFVIVALGVAHQAHAFCQPGDVQACFVNGQPGTRTCGDDARFGPCIPDGSLTEASAACPVATVPAALDASPGDDTTATPTTALAPAGLATLEAMFASVRIDHDDRQAGTR
jgi:hypothetical protein